jgi:hypothetical protein
MIHASRTALTRMSRSFAVRVPRRKYKYKYKYKNTCDTGQTRNKLLPQRVHLTNHAAGHSRLGTAHLTAQIDLSRTAIHNDAVNRNEATTPRTALGGGEDGHTTCDGNSPDGAAAAF